ncbi:hypothetical protein TWF694_011577 [Orbilia ellipsospora]|uniref:Uncharacterized protein n=1 Tax=Orbilia ellipsospora TaxID=2528407 RepID=A0AAV9X6V9_9PEZI
MIKRLNSETLTANDDVVRMAACLDYKSEINNVPDKALPFYFFSLLSLPIPFPAIAKTATVRYYYSPCTFYSRSRPPDIPRIGIPSFKNHHYLDNPRESIARLSQLQTYRRFEPSP